MQLTSTINLDWDELIKYCDSIEIETYLPKKSCEGSPPHEFDHNTISNDIDRTEFFADNPCWYNRNLRIGVACTGGFCESGLLQNHDEKYWCISRKKQDVHLFGVLYHPIIKFVSMLKYVKYTIRTNITGHFRGTFVVGPNMLRNILEFDYNWYMQQQTEILKNVDFIIKQKAITTIKSNILFKVNGLPYLFTASNVEDAENLSSVIESPVSLKYQLIHYLLHYRPKGNYHLDNWIGRHAIMHRGWNRFIDRHLDLEMSAWDYIVQDKQLTDLLHKRYAKDFELGGYQPMQQTFDEHYG